MGYTVLAGAMDKPHGLREVYLLDQDGYLWVPGIALQEGESPRELLRADRGYLVLPESPIRTDEDQ